MSKLGVVLVAALGVAGCEGDAPATAVDQNGVPVQNAAAVVTAPGAQQPQPGPAIVPATTADIPTGSGTAAYGAAGANVDNYGGGVVLPEAQSPVPRDNPGTLFGGPQGAVSGGAATGGATTGGATNTIPTNPNVIGQAVPGIGVGYVQTGPNGGVVPGTAAGATNTSQAAANGTTPVNNTLPAGVGTNGGVNAVRDPNAGTTFPGGNSTTGAKVGGVTNANANPGTTSNPTAPVLNRNPTVGGTPVFPTPGKSVAPVTRP